MGEEQEHGSVLRRRGPRACQFDVKTASVRPALEAGGWGRGGRGLRHTRSGSGHPPARPMSGDSLPEFRGLLPDALSKLLRSGGKNVLWLCELRPHGDLLRGQRHAVLRGRGSHLLRQHDVHVAAGLLWRHHVLRSLHANRTLRGVGRPHHPLERFPLELYVGPRTVVRVRRTGLWSGSPAPLFCPPRTPASFTLSTS